MSQQLDVEFVSLSDDLEPTAVVIGAEAKDALALSDTADAFNSKSSNAISRAARAADFTGKAKSWIELLAPSKLKCQRLIVVGAGPADNAKTTDWVLLGGAIAGRVTARKTKSASVVADVVETGGKKAEDIAADLALGLQLRCYSFEKYKTDAGPKSKKESGNAKDSKTAKALERIVIHCDNPKKTAKAYEDRRAIANGVTLARDLVNEPANTLGPVEFANIAKDLEKSGLEVEILDDEALEELGMGALLSVGLGSAKPSRVAVMQWNGAKSKRTKPIAFVGKGVVFDTGGISIKPAAGMEGMKGDMGGAACVTGLMRTLAERKANVNAVGLIGLVENMPDGKATRPGDIVTSMSKQTIEVLNTDAEGRLVLADVLWYTQQRFKPKLVIDLATLTGAIMIALGKDFAGLFANDDRLASNLLDASKKTDEKLWRMPLDASFDKMIKGSTGDIKNLGGRWGGACTAAAFIKRFIDDTPWAHIDLAGTAMDASSTDINRSWGSGWGVRLLDRFVADHHEK